MPSFDAVNYAIRPNKNVERKLVFSSLREIDRLLDLSGHRYVGMGSVWFVDFVLAHKWLSIKDMISIEADEIGYRRASFNRPLACIETRQGETSAVLPEIDFATKPSLLWLDYDSGIGGPAIADISNVLPRLRPGSIFVVTLNAKKDDLPTKNEADEPISPQVALRQLVGDLLPTHVPTKRFQRDEYPRLLGEIIRNHFRSIHLSASRTETWVELFDIVYFDSTPMVTVGGMVAAANHEARVRDLVADARWRGRQADAISLPPLTLKEKIALDGLMPCASPLTQEAVGLLGFMLRAEQIRAYCRHYKDYPVYGEVVS